MVYSRERETEAAHALTHNQEVWSNHGYAVVTAGGLTAGSNALQLDVGPYDVLTGDTTSVSVGPATIDAQLPDSDPYWLVVYVDGSGTLQTAAGPEGAVAPGLGVDVREISSPPPPTLADVGPVTVLGRALVTEDGIADARIDDRVFGGERVFESIDAASGVFNSIDAGSVNTGSLVIGGTLYEEDDNSPVDVTGQSSITFTPAESWDEIYIIPEPTTSIGYDELQINGDTSSSYDYIDNSDTKTTGATAFENLTQTSFASFYHIRGSNDDRFSITVPLGIPTTGKTVAGQITNVEPPITQFTLSDGGGSNRSLFARVYGRAI